MVLVDMRGRMTYKPRYFLDKELYCKCGCDRGGLTAMDACILWLADAIRSECGFPLHVNSALRCPAHNKAVGGAPNSYHLKGQAMDIRPCLGADFLFQLKKLYEVAERLNPKGGVGMYEKFVHVDCGPKRRWKG